MIAYLKIPVAKSELKSSQLTQAFLALQTR